jgi:hypothetical protein
MDHDGFQRYPQHQRSENSAAPLAAAAQYEQRTGASAVGSEYKNRQSESTFHNPITASFSNRDEGEGSAPSIHPLPPVLQEITPIGIQAVHPDPRARPLSIHRTMSIGPQNGLDWIVPREENSEKVSKVF